MIGKIEHTMAEDIIGIVSDYYGIHKDKLFSKTRLWDVVHARQVACYMIRKYTNIPKLAIGRQYFNQARVVFWPLGNRSNSEPNVARQNKADVKYG
jgi:hypothetical protein